MRDSDQIITPCADESYCCGANNNTCCDRGDGIWIRDGRPTTVNPNAAVPPTSSAISSDSTIPATQGFIPSPPEPQGLTGAAIAGIVIGCLLGLGILGLAFWYFARRKRQGIYTGGQYNPTDGKAALDQHIYSKEKRRANYDAQELHGTYPVVHEMHAGAPPVPELHGAGRPELAGSSARREMN
ncbi:MAG: hypothetical protein Q9169_005191 [Polycauliona sp. 2 TL-2023]